MARMPIGVRLAKWRDIANMTQQQLADATGYSKSYISLLELGKRPITDTVLIANLAHGLGIDVHDLQGRPYAPADTADLLNYTIVPLMRTALEDPDEDVETRNIRELDLVTDRAMAARMSCDMETIGEILPGLIAETRQLWYGNGNGDRAAAGMLFVKALVTGALAFKATGFIDLAIRMSEQAGQVAGVLDPISAAAARFTAAQCALAVGNRKRSIRLAELGAAEMDRYVISTVSDNLRNEGYAWMGMLHLQAALSAAGTEGGDPQGHLNQADVISRHVTGDPWRMEFGQPNVRTWEIGIALDNGQPERAPALAARVDVSQLRTAQRRARVRLDHGRGLFLTGDFEGATRQLLLADQAAPGDLRQRPSAVETVTYMIRHSRVGSPELAELATKVGVDIDAVLAA